MMADSSPLPDIGCEVEVSSKKQKRGESTHGRPSRLALGSLPCDHQQSLQPGASRGVIAASTKRKACHQTKQSKAKSENPPESQTRKRKVLNKTQKAKAKATLSL